MDELKRGTNDFDTEKEKGVYWEEVKQKAINHFAAKIRLEIYKFQIKNIK